MTTLPLVDYIVRTFSDVSLERVKIIGVQHILRTTHSMFRSLYARGLKPENISLIGKCYSTNLDVLADMRKDGIDVTEESSSYCSHTSFDHLFDALVLQFLRDRLSDVEKYERIIIIDDGGHFLQAVGLMGQIHPRIVGIEQTSSGINGITHLDLKLPIISVATCKAKRIYETPMIAGVIEQKLFQRLAVHDIQPKRCLIIGGGSIGSHLSRSLSQRLPTVVYDQVPSRSDLRSIDFYPCLTDSDLVIGCTGTTSLPAETGSLLWPGTTLVSASSSDREFEAVEYRRQVPLNSNCHADVLTDTVTVLNSGFPINFDGGQHSVAPSSIQLTRALLAGAILQAVSMPYPDLSGIVPLAGRLQTSIVRQYLCGLIPSNTPKDGLFVKLFRKIDETQKKSNSLSTEEVAKSHT
jgi:hypothetical protein